MKKTLPFLLLLLCVMSSCKDKKDEHVDYSTDIIGTWTFSKISKMGIETNNKQINKQIAEGLKDIDKADFDEMQGYVKFSEDGRYESESNGIAEEGTYKLDGRTLTMNQDGETSEKVSINIYAKVLEISVEIDRDMISKELEKLTEGDPELAAQIREMERAGVSINKMSMTMVYTK